MAGRITNGDELCRLKKEYLFFKRHEEARAELLDSHYMAVVKRLLHNGDVVGAKAMRDECPVHITTVFMTDAICQHEAERTK